jgi:hypothetical protein
MDKVSRSIAGVMVVTMLVVGLVGTGSAQTPAGKVSRVEGTVSVARTASPTALPLKGKDEVYQRDLVSTGEQSRAQLILGGKAVVTIREQSKLRITETPGIATVDITDGKLKLAVRKQDLKPGDLIEVRSATAITAVRGTAVVVEVGPTGSLVTVLDGIVEVTPLDPATGRPRGPAVRLAARQQLQVGAAGAPAPPRTLNQADAQKLDATFAFALKAGAPSSDVVQRQMNQAASDAAGLQGGGTNLVNPGGTGEGGPGLSGDDIRRRNTPAPPAQPKGSRN